jgi:hypothetical protein
MLLVAAMLPTPVAFRGQGFACLAQALFTKNRGLTLPCVGASHMTPLVSVIWHLSLKQFLESDYHWG